jgi:predicted small metal-binding protein
MPSIECMDLGTACPFKVSAKAEEELMKKIGEHAAKEIDMKDVSPAWRSRSRRPSRINLS